MFKVVHADVYVASGEFVACDISEHLTGVKWGDGDTKTGYPCYAHLRAVGYADVAVLNYEDGIEFLEQGIRDEGDLAAGVDEGVPFNDVVGAGDRDSR
ncbi:MAG: hypothetical protein OXG47_03750 [bacterium]|nr:hypothetical protein [bacterium]